MNKKLVIGCVDYKTKFGNNRSHAMNISKRSWKHNFHFLKSNLFTTKIKLSIRDLKTINNKFPNFWLKYRKKHEK